MRRLLLAVLPLALLAACASDDAATSVPETPVADGPAAEPSAPPFAQPPAADADTLTVVFFGDSITAGYGLGGQGTADAGQAYPALVEARAREAGAPVRVVNAGVSGETTAGGRSRIGWFLQDVRPDVFVLALGGNDGLRGLDPAAMEANLVAILEAVRATNPEARLVVAGMEALPNYGADYTARFRAVFPAVAARFDAALVPFLLEGVGGVRALNQRDGVHPTAEGQRRIAATVWPVVEPVLAEAAAG